MADKPFCAEDLIADLQHRRVTCSLIKEDVLNVRQVQLNVRGFKVEVTRARPSSADAVLAYETIMVPSFKELACMKMAAAVRRGAKRDIADIYFLTRAHFRPDELVRMVCDRYAEHTPYALTTDQVIKGILNFEERLTYNDEDELDLVVQVPWTDIKETVKTEFGAL